MNSYQKGSLERMLRIYDFIRANPGCTIFDMQAHFDVRLSALRVHVQHLRDSEHVDWVPGIWSRNGQTPATHTVTALPRPASPPPAKRAGRKLAPVKSVIEQPKPLPEARRTIKKAQQIGVVRDEMLTYLFGPAKAVA